MKFCFTLYTVHMQKYFLLSWHLNNFKMYIHIKMFKSMLRVCNQPMPHFNAMDSRGLPPNQGSAMDGWGTSDASEDAEVQSGTVLKRPSHPAALGGIGLTGGGHQGRSHGWLLLVPKLDPTGAVQT